MATSPEQQAAQLAEMKVEIIKMLKASAETEKLLAEKDEMMKTLEIKLNYVNIKIGEMEAASKPKSKDDVTMYGDEKTDKYDKGNKWRLAQDKGMGDINKYGGDVNEYEDWSFTIGLFMNRRKGMEQIIEWLRGCTQEPKDYEEFILKHPEFDQQELEQINAELYEVMILKLTGDPNTMVRNVFSTLKMKRDYCLVSPQS